MVRILHIVFVWSILVYAAYGQPKKISPEEAWRVFNALDDVCKKCDTAKVMASSLFMYNQASEARRLLTEAVRIAEEGQLESELAGLYFELSRCDERDRNFNEAIVNAQMALQFITDDNDPLKGKVLTHLSRYNLRSNNLPSMMAYFELANQWNSAHQPYLNWVLYEQMNEFYVNLGDLDKSEETLMHAYNLTRPVGNRMDHGLVLYRLRQLASRRNDMAMFARYEKEYYELTRESGGGKMIHGIDLGGQFSTDEAIRKYKQLLVETEKIDFPEAKNNIYALLVGLYIKKNDPQSGLMYQAKIDTSEGGLKFMEDFHTYYSKLYKMAGNDHQALRHTELYMNIKDQLQEEQKQKQILALEAQYESEKKENEIRFLKLEDEAKSNRIQKSEKEKWYLVLFSLMMASLLGLVGYLFYQNRKKNTILEENNKIISSALADKDILLREIHHRVKNNLQVVSSLLNLQSNYISDAAALEAINEGKNRVTSMALIHQNLYTEDHLTSIDTLQYFDNLIDQLFESYQIDEQKIQLEKNIDSIQVDVDTMVPLGLIANELISNALKHAFKERNKGLLSFSLKDKGHSIEIRIRDNGVGLQPETFTSSPRFGNKMVQAFVHKLKARMSISHDGGTEFTLLLDHGKADRA